MPGPPQCKIAPIWNPSIRSVRRIASICLLIAATGGPSATAADRPVETATIRMLPTPPAGDNQRAHAPLAPRLPRPHLADPAGVGGRRPGRARAAGRNLTAGCRRLDLALARLDTGRLLLAPDPSVSLHLEETLRSLTDAADSCTQGAYFMTTWRLREADDSWRQLRGRLLLYGLAP